MRFFLKCFIPLIAACQSAQSPIDTVSQVDLERYSGDWFVIASIGTFIERDAYNAIESYELMQDGSIATEFRFRNGGFDAPVKTYHPTGFVREENNAVWGMQFIWPFKADYRIIYLDEDYEITVIGRNARDYVWIMARKPQIAQAEYRRLVALIAKAGYDPSELRRIPQHWPETCADTQGGCVQSDDA